MTILTVRRLAADILNIGKRRVRISPDGLKEAEGALTRSDVKGLIEKGVITKAKIQGRDSTARKKRKGHGRRKGSFGNQKELWMQKVRAQRKLLTMLIEGGILNKKHKRSLYGKVKSGIFRNKRAMFLYLKDNGLVKKDVEMPKREKPVKIEKKKVPKPKEPEVKKKEGKK
jgi:large subunit ribosomal protein L19e